MKNLSPLIVTALAVGAFAVLVAVVTMVYGR